MKLLALPSDSNCTCSIWFDLSDCVTSFFTQFCIQFCNYVVGFVETTLNCAIPLFFLQDLIWFCGMGWTILWLCNCVQRCNVIQNCVVNFCDIIGFVKIAIHQKKLLAILSVFKLYLLDLIWLCDCFELCAIPNVFLHNLIQLCCMG